MAPTTPDGIVYLSEQEVERIRNTIKDRITKRSSLTGHVREPRDSKAAISQATGASLMADMGTMTSTQSTLPALAVGEPYPPCILPRQELQKVQLSALRLETHHHGFQLAVKRVSPVVTLSTKSWAMVQDEAGETERLEIVLHKTRHGKDMLECASSFVLKEPYFTLTEEGEPTLRVDHPSDIIILSQQKAHHPLDHRPVDAEEAALSHKRKGNTALQNGNLELAHTHYTAALALLNPVTPTPSLIHDLHRNRAHVNLLLGHYTAAKADALVALIPPEIQPTTDPQTTAELNSKSYFRAATAAYNLRHFTEAHALSQAQLSLMPGDKTASANLARTKARLREQREGVYDFVSIKAALVRVRGRGNTKAGWEVEAASFVRYTEIRDSPGKGRGLFIVRDVAAGEVVMVEKAYCAVRGLQTAVTFDVRDERIRVAAVGLERAVVERLIGNPEEVEEIMDLFGDWDGGVAKGVRETEDGPVLDVFRVHDIVARNAFGFEEGGAGLWVRAAYINHSCVPNVEREFVGDLMVVRATRNVAAGEELLHSYDQSGDYDARHQALSTTWGFECNCALCVAEKGDDRAVRARRRKLAKEADAFVESTGFPAKRLAILKAQRLMKAIDGTYDGERFKGLPRLASREIRQWLAKASSHG